METCFRRLEIYTELPTNREMVDTIATIMVQVISILAIATEEINQGRMSKSLLYKYVTVDVNISEKYPKLVGRTDVGDALTRLDDLTRGVARMAAAEALKVTQKVPDVDKVRVTQQSAMDVDQVKRL
jgi:hypothetical protein